ncbi:MAG: replication initiator protein A [Saezia sp.]
MAIHDSIFDDDDINGGTILNPDKHPQRDFFIADIVDASFKDDLASMEHPLFALRAGDTKTRVYETENATVTIRPNELGMATIFDKDIWIYCISQLVEAINRDRDDMSRTVRFTAYDFLVTTNRDTSGRAYERLKDALERLSGTRITTDIRTDGKRTARGFGLIESWEIVEKDNEERMIALEVTLPDWLYRSVTSMSVVTLSPQYFRIRKPLHRRIYEIARKHCGRQEKWIVSLDLLKEKTGSQSNKRLFKEDVKHLSEVNDLPDYEVIYNEETDQITFIKR